MAKEYSRTQRLGPLLKEEIARLLQREVKDVRIGTVTVTDVAVTPDLKQATVYVQIPGDDARKAEAIEGLSSAAGFIRSRVGRELRIRRAPELQFEIDRTQERAARIHELLAEVDLPEEPPEDEDGG
jgi:ribosome-binding factor A